MTILGIDPGKKGSFFWRKNGKNVFQKMPLSQNVLDLEMCIEILVSAGPNHVALEWAIPIMMGRKHAFNYGFDFGMLVSAIKVVGVPYTQVHPKTWQKVMHAGINAKLHPKIRSAQALSRLAPDIYNQIEKNKKGEPDDGMVDAALLCLWGERSLGLA